MWRWLLPVAVACVAAYVLVQTSQHTLHVDKSHTHLAPLQVGYEHPCLKRPNHPITYKHVIWIVFGERKFSNVIGKRTKATYVNQLATECGLATQYFSVTHPALPDLMASVAGTTPPGFTRYSCDGCHTSAPSLFKQVPSWGVYMQSMPTNCRASDADGGYVARMNPAVYFRGVGCPARDHPLGSTTTGPLAKALDAGTLPRLSVIVPDECHSMSFAHGCGSTKLGVLVFSGDRWLQGWMRRLLASPEYTSGQTAIFITWVDGTPGKPAGVDCVKTHLESCHVATLVVAPYVKAGIEVATPFSHYSLLRTTETLLGVPRRLGGARSAPGMRVLFGL
jgi:phosphatidylinositol-3-phosphatase